MSKNRVVVTGMGLICSLGNNREEILAGIKNKKQGLTILAESSEISKLAGMKKVSTSIFGEVNLDEIGFVFPDEIKIKDKTIKLAYMAAKEAVLDALQSVETHIGSLFENSKCALVFGSCNGKLLNLERLYQRFDDMQSVVTHNISFDETYSEFCRDHYSNFDFLGKEYKITGPKFVFVNGCSASSNALGFAFDLVANGEVDLAIVGGSDTLAESTIGGFHSLQALSKDAASPFSERIGLSLGDGAGCIVLESEQHAKARNAKIYAEILGYSFFGDAFHTTSPDETGDGLRCSIDEAIKMANVDKSDIRVICAHGTGTDSNDAVETLAIKNCFGDKSEKLVVTSTKSFYGHTLGASGITQTIMMIDSMLKDFVPPILNFGKERSGCDLNYVKNEPMTLKYDKFIANSLAFGGNNVSMIVGKYDDGLAVKNAVKSVETRLIASLQQNDKIVITGFSALTPLVKNKDEFFERIVKKQFVDLSCISSCHSCESMNLNPDDNKSYEILRAAQDDKNVSRIIEFDSFSISNPNPRLRKFKKKPRVSQLAIEATEQLLTDANYTNFDSRKLGIIFGICKGGMSVFETTYLDMLQNGIEFYSAMNFPNAVLSAITGNVSIALGIKGYNSTMWGPFSPFAGINYAAEILKSGRQDAIIVGGADQMSMYDKKMIDESRYKNSFISEGAATILLETEKNAKARGAKIYAELVGINTNSFDFDYFETSPNVFEKAFSSCIDETLKKANLTEQDIDLHINCNFGLPENFKQIFKGTLTSQNYIGTLESATALLNVGLGILNFSLSDDKKPVKNILVSAHTLNGVNYTFVMRKV